MAQTFKQGDRVAFTGNFLRDTGMQVGGFGDMRATVLNQENHLVTLTWDGRNHTNVVHSANICLVGSPAMGAR